MPTLYQGTPWDYLYTRVIELYDTDGVTLVRTLCDAEDNISVVDGAEFEWLRQGGCGGGTFNIALDFPIDEIHAGQHIKCSYKSGDPWYFGRIESVRSVSQGEATITTYGLMSALSEIQVGGQPWWSTQPQTFGRYDYFSDDPDHAVQNYSYVPTMQDMIQLLFDDYISVWSGGLITLGTIDAPTDPDSFASLTLRGGESLSQILRTCADLAGGASYGVNASNQFFFIPLNTTEQSSFKEGGYGDVERLEDRSVMYNRLIIVGGYVYGVPGNPGFYVWNSHHEESTSVATFGPKTLTVKIPLIRNHVEALNFANGFFSKYAGATTKYTFTTISQSGPLYPWAGSVTLYPADGTTWLGETSVTDTFDSCKVEFNEAPKFTFTTGPEEPQYPVPEVSAAGEQSAGGGGGGGGGNAGNVSGFSSIITAYSIDSCFWPPCNNATVGFEITSAFPSSGYVVGDVYYMTRPVCPRTGVTFFDMEDAIGNFIALGDSTLTASDYIGRFGTASYFRRYAEHSITGCKWFITGLNCPTV